MTTLSTGEGAPRGRLLWSVLIMISVLIWPSLLQPPLGNRITWLVTGAVLALVVVPLVAFAFARTFRSTIQIDSGSRTLTLRRRYLFWTTDATLGFSDIAGAEVEERSSDDVADWTPVLHLADGRRLALDTTAEMTREAAAQFVTELKRALAFQPRPAKR